MEYKITHELREALKAIILGSIHPKLTLETVGNYLTQLEQPTPIIEEPKEDKKK